MRSGRSLFITSIHQSYQSIYIKQEHAKLDQFQPILTNGLQFIIYYQSHFAPMFAPADHSSPLASLCARYPCLSPYIESNLQRFGSGPSSTMLPIQNQIPVLGKQFALNSTEYFSKTQYHALCHCCLQPAEDGLAHSSTADADNPHSAQLAQENGGYSQTTLLKYFRKGKGEDKAVQNNAEQGNKKQLPVCCDCSKIICQNCSRKCSKCFRTVCKFDYREDNSLGYHYCS